MENFSQDATMEFLAGSATFYFGISKSFEWKCFFFSHVGVLRLLAFREDDKNNRRLLFDSDSIGGDQNDFVVMNFILNLFQISTFAVFSLHIAVNQIRNYWPK